MTISHDISGKLQEKTETYGGIMVYTVVFIFSSKQKNKGKLQVEIEQSF